MSEPVRKSLISRPILSILICSSFVSISMSLAFPYDAHLSPSSNPQLQHEVTVTNIAVVVRVYKGSEFVGDLRLGDFEVFEDGVPQKIESVHLVRKSEVENVEPGRLPESRTLLPEIEQRLQTRHFLLVFELDEYLMELNNAVDLFFNEVLAPGDTLRVMTPDSAWHLKAEALDNVPREVQAEHLKSRLRKSLQQCGSQLRFKLATLKHLADDVNEGAGYAGMQAADVIREIIHLKSIEEASLAKLSELLTGLPGQKHVILFHQRETLVIPAVFRRLFERTAIEENRSAVSIDRIRRLFTDSETAVHFLYVTKNKGMLNDVEFKASGGMLSVELGGDFYQTFRNMAKVTGGIMDSSANPTFQLQKTVVALENYYLLYYKPAAYRADGKIKNIEIKVKRPGCRVLHRTGYIVK